MHYIDVVINWVLSLPPIIVYFFLFISAFTENICPPIPGDTIVAFGAFLAGQNKINFFIAYICATIGSLAGFMFVFWLGLMLGKKFFMEKKYLFFKEEDIIKAEQWLKKYGYFIILVNRYIPGLRAVVSITSGILRLSSIKVMITALMGCAIWNLFIMYIGLNIGSNWNEIKYKFGHFISQYNMAVLILLFCLITAFFIIRWVKKKQI